MSPASLALAVIYAIEIVVLAELVLAFLKIGTLSFRFSVRLFVAISLFSLIHNDPLALKIKVENFFSLAQFGASFVRSETVRIFV